MNSIDKGNGEETDGYVWTDSDAESGINLRGSPTAPVHRNEVAQHPIPEHFYEVLSKSSHHCICRILNSMPQLPDPQSALCLAFTAVSMMRRLVRLSSTFVIQPAPPLGSCGRSSNRSSTYGHAKSNSFVSV